MTNDALIKEARDIDKTREHWPLIKRLADALTAANAREAQRSNFGNLSKETTEVIEGLRGWNNDPKLLSQAGESQLAVLELADALDNWKTEAEENADLVVSLEAQLAALRKEAAEAIWQAYKEGCNDGVFNENDNTSKPGRFFCDSAARRAAQRIGGAE